MRLMFGIQLRQSRDLLSIALKEISAQPRLWNAVLYNQTDHHWAMPYLLGRFCRSGQLALRAGTLPLQTPPEASNKDIQPWLNLQKPVERKLEDIRADGLYSVLMEFGRDMTMEGLQRPVENYNSWTVSELWPVLQNWLPNRGFFGKFGGNCKQKRCLILRFHRFIQYQPTPIISHWSTGREFHKDVLQLYDCTANKQATHSLAPTELALHAAELDQRHVLALEPSSLWFLEKI